ncbi:hypothetical protein ACET3X_004746 [Alternaria dauci]|uniref:Uncharacterized protein n=1 Tax=Alternaria dauci TaxID=48095 RepID=A0ABR3UKZ5_9PLEO
MDAHDVLKIAKTVRARHLHAGPGTETPDKVKSGRVIKTIARNRDRISSDKSKMNRAPKSTLYPSPILWANEAGWMKPMLGLAPADDSKLTNDYIHALLKGSGYSNPKSADYLLEVKKLRANQTKWQGEIMKDFFYPRVAIIIGEWEAKAENKDKKFGDFTPAELKVLWERDFDEAPEVMATKMWGSIGKMVAWDQIFDLELGDAETRARLKATRGMMRAKYVFACEQTFKWRYSDPATMVDVEEGGSHKTREERCYAAWRSFCHKLADVMVDYANLPVAKTPPNSRSKESNGSILDGSECAGLSDTSES